MVLLTFLHNTNVKFQSELIKKQRDKQIQVGHKSQDDQSVHRKTISIYCALKLERKLLLQLFSSYLDTLDHTLLLCGAIRFPRLLCDLLTHKLFSSLSIQTICIYTHTSCLRLCPVHIILSESCWADSQFLRLPNDLSFPTHPQHALTHGSVTTHPTNRLYKSNQQLSW